MPGLAADMKRIGVRPGIWVRPTALNVVDDPKRLRRGPSRDEEKPLDLTLPENLQAIRDDIARLSGWGYELIKHDFSTYDAFGRWGFDMGAELTDGKWSFADQSLTNAEIILELYHALRDGAGDAVLLGCNTIGHLGAGSVRDPAHGRRHVGARLGAHAAHGRQHAGVSTAAARRVLPERSGLRGAHRRRRRGSSTGSSSTSSRRAARRCSSRSIRGP